MTLTQLEYVVAVYKNRHFGKAAKACSVTQPTLSMQLQKLEDELQVTIFDRSKSPVAPTQEGNSIIEQAKKILHEQKKLFNIIDEGKKELSGDFKLAVIPTLSPFIIPLFLEKFTTKYPLVNIEITENKTQDIIELLIADEIDAALIVTPLHEESIFEKVLYYEPFYLIVSQKHQLAKKQTIKQEDLDLNEIWLLNKGNCFRDQVLNICAKRNEKSFKNPINFESGNFETLKNMVISGNGYTLLPHMGVKQLSPHLKKMIRQFVKPVPTREVSLVCSQNTIKQRILTALEEEIKRVIPDDLKQKTSKSLEVIDIY